MKTWKSYSAVLSAALSLVVADANGKELRAPNLQDPFPTFDPVTGRESGAILFTLSPISQLLESHSSALDTTWTFRVRENVVWSDNTPFSIDDVAYTLNLIRSNDLFTSPLSLDLRAQIADVTLNDEENSFTVSLRAPNPRFGHLFTSPDPRGVLRVLPKHIWEGNEEDFVDAKPLVGDFTPFIGTGPYVLTNATADTLTFERDEDWWGAESGQFELPEPESLLVRDFSTREAAMEALVQNEIDIGPEVNRDEFRDIAAENPMVIAWAGQSPISWPGACPRQLTFNVASPPWDDPSLRAAVAHYIDQSQVVAAAYDGETSPSPTLFPDHPALRPTIDAIAAAGLDQPSSSNPAAGDEKLTDAGFIKTNGTWTKDSTPLALTIHVSNSDARDSAAVKIIRDQLSAAGVDATMAEVDGARLWARIMPRGEFEAVYSWPGCGALTDPYESLRRFDYRDAMPIGHRSPGQRNMGRWSGVEAEAFAIILDEIAKHPPDQPEVLDLTVEAYAHFSRDFPFVPIVQEARILPFNTTRWTGWPTKTNAYAYPDVTWGEFRRILDRLE